VTGGWIWSPISNVEMGGIIRLDAKNKEIGLFMRNTRERSANAKSIIGVRLMSLGLTVSLFCSAFAYDVTVRWNEVQQKITGFGACTGCGGAYRDLNPGTGEGWYIHSMPEPARTECLDLLFDSIKGIGLNMFRFGESWELEDPDGTWHWGAGRGPQEIWIAKEALKRNANMIFWSAPWTAPLWMKTVQTMGGGSLQSQYYQRYADYKSHFIRDMRDKEGIALTANSIQNEPHFNPGYGGCYYSGSNIRDFVKNNLGPTFARDGISTKILIAETNWNQPAWVDVSMFDSVARSYVGIVAFHNYETDVIPYPRAAQYGKELWQTETSLDPWSGVGDLTMNQARPFTIQLHKCMALARVSAWHYYEFIGGGNPPLRLSGSSYQIAKLLYCIGNYSKFLKPGWHMIGANNFAPDSLFVGVTAYRDSSNGKFAIVATNWDKIESHDLSFTLQGIRTAKVTPFLTDDNNHSLNQMAVIPVTGGQFTTTLPIMSVTTFTGAAVPIAAGDVDVDSFVASSHWVAPGSPDTLSWATKNATSVSISNVTGAIVPSGSAVVSPSSTTTYTLSAQGPNGPVLRTVTVIAQAPREPENPSPVVAGLTYEYYEGVWQKIPDLNSLTPKSTGTTINFFPMVAGYRATGDYAIRYKGYINIPATGYYTFFTKSDFASRLLIGTTLVVDNDKGVADERSGAIALKAGMHAIAVEFHQTTNIHTMVVSWQAPELGMPKKQIPMGGLFRIAPPAAIGGAATQVPIFPSMQIVGLDRGFRVNLSIPVNGNVLLQIVDQHGRIVRTLRNGMLPAGRSAIGFNGCDNVRHPLPAGPYWCIAHLRNGQTFASPMIIKSIGIVK
jgi:glucuronoarabinoxylan endo-1,4-beta-xylanase